MIDFGLIGTGWRAEFFLRIARACPEHFRVTGIVGRTPEKTRALAEHFDIPVFASAADLVRQTRPLFVALSIARGGHLPLLTALTDLEMPVLCETPPGETLEELNGVWALVGRGGRIQIAEQFHAQPHHAARLAFVAAGKLGRVSEVQISVSHGYHGISLMRRFLGVRGEAATITARRYTFPIVQGRGRTPEIDSEKIVPSTQTIAHFDFGDRLGVFDFTGDQYFSFIRGQRVLVRGERGEIIDERAVYLQDYRTPIQVQFLRQVAGANGNLEGLYLKGIIAGESWVYTNPFIPAALTDEEIAVGTCLLRMATYVREGVDFYSAAEGIQDRYLDLMMEEAVKTGQTIHTEPQAWSAQV